MFINISVSIADQKNIELKTLFNDLRTSKNYVEVERRIWHIWYKNNNPQVSALMNQSVKKMHSGNTISALAGFSKIIKMDPNYAEGWNKRATVYYLMNDFEKSISDITMTLNLEPRHFGALSGLAMIYAYQGKKEKAKKIIINLINIYPRIKLSPGLESLRKQIGQQI